MSSRSKPAGKKTKKPAFQMPNLENGEPNPKYVDVLEVGVPVEGQTHWVAGFISPEKILKQKEQYFFEQFVKKWDFIKSMEKFHDFLGFIAYKYGLKPDDVFADFKDFGDTEKVKLQIYTVLDDYKNFLDAHEDTLQENFNIAHKFQTNVRGLMMFGAYGSEEGAKEKAEVERERMPHLDIVVGEVGKMSAWDPDAYKIGNVQYMVPELNQLMHENLKNQAMAKSNFKQRVMDAKQEAMKTNETIAEKSNNKLSQTLDEHCNLIGINNVNTTELVLQQSGEAVSAANVERELFEGDNIVMTAAAAASASE